MGRMRGTQEPRSGPPLPPGRRSLAMDYGPPAGRKEPSRSAVRPGSRRAPAGWLSPEVRPLCLRIERTVHVFRSIALRSGLVLLGWTLADTPALTQSRQSPPTRHLQAQSAQRDGQTGRRARRGTADTFHTEVPRRPFDIVLGDPTGSSITVSIAAYSPLEGYFEYGDNSRDYGERTEIVRLEPDVPAEVKLTGLHPNIRYFYRWNGRVAATDAFQASDEYSFRTGRAQGDAFVFTVQADSHLDGRTDTRLYEATLRNAKAAGPDFHIDLGDTFMTDKRRPDYEDALPQYAAQRYYFGLIGTTAPVFLVSGNHDGEGLARGAMGEWARERRDAFFATPTDGVSDRGNYYSWEWGDALFVALDPYWESQRVRRGGDYWARTLGERQFRWLARNLRSTRARFKFVFVHHLVGGVNQAARGGAAAAGLFEWGGRSLNGEYQFGERRPGWGKPIHQMLVDAGVDIVFHGHDHVFAREELDGVTYLLVPQPGLDRYGAPRDIEGLYEHADVVGGPGHVRVTVSPEAAFVELVQSRLDGAEDGRTAYSFRVPPGPMGERQ